MSGSTTPTRPSSLTAERDVKPEWCVVPECDRKWMYKSVRLCQRHYFRKRRTGSVTGSTPRKNLWTSPDDLFILDHPEMTAKAVGDFLGRTADAITQRRRLLQRVEKTDYTRGKSNTNPTRIGGRTLLAKTCPECGLLLDGDWFRRYADKRQDNGWHYSTACRACQSARSVAPEARERQKAWTRRMQALTADRATRRNEEYTDADIKILESDLSLVEMAILTKRTLYGVRDARNAFGMVGEPPRLGDPTEGVWVIRFATQRDGAPSGAPHPTTNGSQTSGETS